MQPFGGKMARASMQRSRKVSSAAAPSIAITGSGTSRTITITGATGGTWQHFQPNPPSGGTGGGQAGIVAWNVATTALKSSLNSKSPSNLVFGLVTGTPGAVYNITWTGDPGTVTVDGSGLT